MKLAITILIIFVILLIIYNLYRKEKYNSIIEKLDTPIGITSDIVLDKESSSNNALNTYVQPDIKLPLSPTFSPTFSPTYSPAYSPALLNKSYEDINLDFKFSLNINYFDYIYDDETLINFKKNLHNDICKLLSISNYRIVIDDISIGSIIIRLTMMKTKYKDYKPILPNDNLFANNLYDLFEKYVDNLSNLNELDENSLLFKINIYTITKDNDKNNIININNIIPKQVSFIDKLINDKTPFKMYTLLKKEGIYPQDTIVNPLDNNLVKLYLTVNNENNKLDECTFDNGLLELREEYEVTQNSVFTLLSSAPKKILKEDKPFKYIDFNKTYFDPKIKQHLIQSQFYNLQLYNSRINITYCAEGCDNVNAFCAQKQTLNGYIHEKVIEHQNNDVTNLKLTKSGLENIEDKVKKTTTNIVKHKLSDTHELKNFLKLKIENEENMIVTPYFISKNPVERIYFITNKYNILGESSNYKKLIQIPKYVDESNYGSVEKPYYETPVYKNNALTYEKTLITGLFDPYTPDEIKEFKNKKSMKDIETHAFKNSAYQYYSLQFYIEPITREDIKKLKKNDNK
jgi:hypothetical protein